ncbi:MAG TPA: hypothetical protein VI612_00165 [Candidatus Nanoarchaeia archaeon]|nr:hypothetical protein [Candidatus Nanoarchaeia archaeon]
MEPIRYFDTVELIEPKCPGCKHIVHYERDTRFDDERQILTCLFCGCAL